MAIKLSYPLWFSIFKNVCIEQNVVLEWAKAAKCLEWASSLFRTYKSLLDNMVSKLIFQVRLWEAQTNYKMTRVTFFDEKIINYEWNWAVIYFQSEVSISELEVDWNSPNRNFPSSFRKIDHSAEANLSIQTWWFIIQCAQHPFPCVNFMFVFQLDTHLYTITSFELTFHFALMSQQRNLMQNFSSSCPPMECHIQHECHTKSGKGELATLGKILAHLKVAPWQ